MDSESLFKDGKLLPAITILGMASQGTWVCEKPPQVMATLCGEHLFVCACVCVPVHACVYSFSKRLPSACSVPGSVCR